MRYNICSVGEATPPIPHSGPVPEGVDAQSLGAALYAYRGQGQRMIVGRMQRRLQALGLMPASPTPGVIDTPTEIAINRLIDVLRWADLGPVTSHTTAAEVTHSIQLLTSLASGVAVQTPADIHGLVEFVWQNTTPAERIFIHINLMLDTAEAHTREIGIIPNPESV